MGNNQLASDQIKEIIQQGYSKMSNEGCCTSKCTCDNGQSNEEISKMVGYSEEEIESVGEANLGLGCGNPVALSNISEGHTVLDLGSGAGFDAFLAVKKVGESGKVIGIDITPEMIEKSKRLAEKYGHENTEFRQGDIEELPVDDESIDVILSNCVINLAPNKEKVFSEAKRVLKEDGRMYISDIVLLSDITEEMKKDEKLLCGCVGGALLKDDYLKIVENSGLGYKIIGEDKEISKEQYNGIDLMSLKLEIFKDAVEVESK